MATNAIGPTRMLRNIRERVRSSVPLSPEQGAWLLALADEMRTALAWGYPHVGALADGLRQDGQPDEADHWSGIAGRMRIALAAGGDGGLT